MTATTVVIFGASGDLTARKPVPALFGNCRKRRLPAETRVVGFARTPYDDDAFRAKMRAAVNEFAPHQFEAESWEAFARHLHYQPGDAGKAEDYAALENRIRELAGPADNRMYYLATAPELYPVAISHIGAAGMARETGQTGFQRIIIEKPFGRDLESARTRSGVSTCRERSTRNGPRAAQAPARTRRRRGGHDNCHGAGTCASAPEQAPSQDGIGTMADGVTRDDALRLPESMIVTSHYHVMTARRKARHFAEAIGLARQAPFEVATCVSELASNLVVHATSGGSLALEAVRRGEAVGMRVIAQDSGPGIASLAEAMEDGFSTVGGLGGGLPAARRLMDDLEITTAAGKGTRIVATKWRLDTPTW